MRAVPIDYVRPGSLTEALELLAAGEGQARLLAGGQSLVAQLAARAVRPTQVIDIDRLGELEFLDVDDEGLRIGALCRHDTLARRAHLDGRWRGLREAARHVGLHPVRVRGTLGGSLAHADPAAELCAAVLAFDGELTARSAGQERRIAAADFFLGPHRTALRADEVITEIRLAAPGSWVSAFAEVSQRAVGWALGAVCAAIAREAGRVTAARIALAGIEATPRRIAAAEHALLGSSLDDGAIGAAARSVTAECAPRADAHAGADYRRRLAGVLTERLLRQLSEAR